MPFASGIYKSRSSCDVNGARARASSSSLLFHRSSLSGFIVEKFLHREAYLFLFFLSFFVQLLSHESGNSFPRGLSSSLLSGAFEDKTMYLSYIVFPGIFAKLPINALEFRDGSKINATR